MAGVLQQHLRLFRRCAVLFKVKLARFVFRKLEVVKGFDLGDLDEVLFQES